MGGSKLHTMLEGLRLHVRRACTELQATAHVASTCRAALHSHFCLALVCPLQQQPHHAPHCLLKGQVRERAWQAQHLQQPHARVSSPLSHTRSHVTTWTALKTHQNVALFHCWNFGWGAWAAWPYPVHQSCRNPGNGHGIICII